MARIVRLLHVEDDPMQEMLLAAYLRAMEEFKFEINCVPSEERAISEFRKSPSDFIILDFFLSQGNGLSCLRLLRQQDAIVPIVAVTGQTDNKIAAQLLESGADDYISKLDLSSEGLAKSVRMALARSDAARRLAGVTSQSAAVKATLESVCQGFLPLTGKDFLAKLDSFETAARQSGLKPNQIPALLEAVCAELTADAPGDLPHTLLYLRPVLLELQLRMGTVTV